MAFSTKALAHFAIPICKIQLESVAKIILSVTTSEDQEPFESGKWSCTSDQIHSSSILANQSQVQSFQDQSQRWPSSSGQSKPPPESAGRTRPRTAAAGGQDSWCGPGCWAHQKCQRQIQAPPNPSKAQITSIQLSPFETWGTQPLSSQRLPLGRIVNLKQKRWWVYTGLNPKDCYGSSLSCFLSLKAPEIGEVGLHKTKSTLAFRYISSDGSRVMPFPRT